MGLFESSNVFEKLLSDFFRSATNELPSVAKKLLASKMVIRFNYHDPEVVIVVDCSGEEIDIRPGDTDSKCIVDMKMSTDIAHKFWYGKVNLVAALTRRQMIAKGPIPKILALLPAIKPAYALYPKYLEKNGYEKYNIH